MVAVVICDCCCVGFRRYFTLRLHLVLVLRCLALVGFAGRGFGDVLVGGALFCGCL